MTAEDRGGDISADHFSPFHRGSSMRPRRSGMSPLSRTGLFQIRSHSIRTQLQTIRVSSVLHSQTIVPNSCTAREIVPCGHESFEVVNHFLQWKMFSVLHGDLLSEINASPAVAPEDLLLTSNLIHSAAVSTHKTFEAAHAFIFFKDNSYWRDDFVVRSTLTLCSVRVQYGLQE